MTRCRFEMKTSQVFLHSTTTITPCPLILFGGKLAYDFQSKILSVNKWICFKSSDESADVYELLREEMDRVLAMRIQNPESANIDRDEAVIVRAIARLARNESKYDDELRIPTQEELNDESKNLKHESVSERFLHSI